MKMWEESWQILRRKVVWAEGSCRVSRTREGEPQIGQSMGLIRRDAEGEIGDQANDDVGDDDGAYHPETVVGAKDGDDDDDKEEDEEDHDREARNAPGGVEG